MKFRIVIRGRNCEKYLEKCIKSLRKQKEEWRGVLILDNPKDNSYELAERLIYGRDLPIDIYLQSERMGLGYNLWFGITHCKAQDEDIVCILDADDYLHKSALRTVRKTYDKGCLVTYGSYVKLSKGRRTKVSKAYKVNVEPRKSKWHGSHLKTFKFKLWKHFPKEYLQYKGKWAEAASDRGLMYALLELAGMKNCSFVKKITYYWKDRYRNSTNVKKQKKWDAIFRAKKPLKMMRMMRIKDNTKEEDGAY